MLDIGEVVRAAVDALASMLGPLLHPIGEKAGEMFIEPLLNVSLSVPGFGVFTAASPLYYRPLEAPMQTIYQTSLLIASFALAVLLPLSLLWLALGEENPELFSAVKRAIVVLVLVLSSRLWYDALASMVSWGAYLLLGSADLKLYSTVAGAALVDLATAATLIGAPAFLASVFVVLVILLVFNAMRLLLTAVLAATLPLWVTLTLAPTRHIRDVAHGAIQTLIGLTLVPLLAAAVYRLGAEIIRAYTPGQLAADSVLMAITFATFFAPVIASVLVPRASTTMLLTSVILGYAAKPAAVAVARQTLPRLTATLKLAAEPLAEKLEERAPRVVGFLRGLHKAYKQPDYPLGPLGYLYYTARYHIAMRRAPRGIEELKE